MKKTWRLSGMLLAITATLLISNKANAYVGPGAGMEFFGYACTLLAMIGIAYFVPCAIVGYFIGRSKGTPQRGAIVGGILGPLGWLIMLMLPNIRPICPYCKGYIVEGAQKCKNCGSFITA
jgi:hypothetical protein